ncbi:uncharacterized protein LOC143470037 [Clavelina lepadiformis]|uniref:uncharacterized protein LOC143470037 n=1 Tax=Clavelina lepadiformis TaxID=159417 RepID=UPI004042D80F
MGSYLSTTSNKQIIPEPGSKFVQKYFSQKDLRLAEDLRKICNEKSKENDPCASAEIFHQMGLLYKTKSPDKISLIRSAALLNAAISRQPSNQQFKDDLQQFCTELLQTAGAEKMDADLMQISNQAAQMIKEMRDTAQQSLSVLENIPYDITIEEQKRLEVKKIHDIKLIQEEITQKYGDVMRYIAEKCIEIMGKKPCEFCIAAMGSLARSEVTPYSDFEHIILLEEGVKKRKKQEKVLEYFRWFSVIFNIIVINLKETIIPSVAIPSLNDVTKKGGDWFFDSYTTRGISFDGMMPFACKFPLGRAEKTKNKPWTTELIQTVSNMVKYLDQEEIIKNGYKIHQVICTTTLIYGSHTIYGLYTDQVKSSLQNNKESNHDLLKQQLKEDLKNFDVFENLNNLFGSSKCNIKRVVYRSTSIFIAALGQLYSIDKVSSFAIIQQLHENKIINDETAHLLSYAVAVSCQVRLSWYMNKQSQDDYVGEDEVFHVTDNPYSKLTDIVGRKSSVDYFIIASKLQKILRNDLDNLRCDITIDLKDKFEMLFLLGLYDQVISESKQFFEHKPRNASLDDEHCIKCLEALAYQRKDQIKESLSVWEQLDQQDIQDDICKGYVMVYKAKCLMELNRYQEALQQVDDIISKIHDLKVPERSKYIWLYYLHNTNGWCKQEMGQYQDAAKEYRESLKYFDLRYDQNQPVVKVNKERTLRNIGCCLYKLGDYDAAISEVKESLKICERNNVPVVDKCYSYGLLGKCHFAKAEYDTALTYFKTKLDLQLHNVRWGSCRNIAIIIFIGIAKVLIFLQADNNVQSL